MANLLAYYLLNPGFVEALYNRLFELNAEILARCTPAGADRTSIGKLTSCAVRPPIRAFDVRHYPCHAGACPRGVATPASGAPRTPGPGTGRGGWAAWTQR